MNEFKERFENRILAFWKGMDKPDEEQLLADILDYANANPEKFKTELEPIKYNIDLSPLALVFEAMATQTEQWGNFYVQQLDQIFEDARTAKNPRWILSNLMEFGYLEKETRPFIQQIADRVYKATSDDFLPNKLAAIKLIFDYLLNPVVHNKEMMRQSLYKKLDDKNWKVRYTTYMFLMYEDMLPADAKLSMADKLRKFFLGNPMF